MPQLNLSRLELKEAIKPFLLFGKNSTVLPILDNAILTFSGDHTIPTLKTNQESDFEVGFNCQFLLNAISTKKRRFGKIFS